MASINVHIVAGGTQFHIRPHLSLAAPAYGNTGRHIAKLAQKMGATTHLHLTAMAGGPKHLDTNDDVAHLVQQIVADPTAKILFMPVALCDYSASVLDNNAPTKSGKDQPRLRTNQGQQTVLLTPADKVISNVRKTRKDLFLVGFKTTAGASLDEQFSLGLKLMKNSSCNLVLANDLHSRTNMVITPEQAAYHLTTNRDEAIAGLVEMALLRSSGTFTRSTVVPGDPVSWHDALVPDSLRTVVDYCVSKGAYKPFLGSTVGHFATKVQEGVFLTSRRKTNFNQIDQVGLVHVQTQGENNVIARGSRPSVGGQSQRIIFQEHPDLDCIVHFHCPIKPGSQIPVRQQRPFECGSHECGANTSRGLARFGELWAVMLEKHGPNIVFNRGVDPGKVIQFIDDNFDLSKSTAEVDFSDQVPS